MNSVLKGQVEASLLETFSKTQGGSTPGKLQVFFLAEVRVLEPEDEAGGRPTHSVQSNETRPVCLQGVMELLKGVSEGVM
jgi:hypothetical protein